MEEELKEFEIEVYYEARKWLVVKAKNSEDATKMAYKVCMENPVTITPEDEPDFWIFDPVEKCDYDDPYNDYY